MEKANEDGASGDAKNKKKNSQNNLPGFLFNNDFNKIQSNAKNIENDSGNNFFYERNIIVKPELPIEKIRAEKQEKDIVKGDDSKGISKEKLRRLSFKR